MTIGYQLTSSGGVVRLADMAFIPQSQENADYREFLEWRAKGNDPLPADNPSIELLVMLEVQQRLDTFARARGYDNIVSLCSYASSSNSRFAADAATGVRVRDEQWGASLAIKQAVLARERPMPTYEQVIAELPPMPVWNPPT